MKFFFVENIIILDFIATPVLNFRNEAFLRSTPYISNYIDIINNELDRIKRLSDEYSIKIQKKQRKLALANITAEDILDAIR